MNIKTDKIIRLQQVVNMLQPQHLPIPTLYKLTKLSNALTENFEFYRNSLQTIINEYALMDEEGKPIETDGNIKIKPECIEECNKRIDELMDTEVQLPDIEFTLSELERADLSMEDFSCLYPFIQE